MTETGRVKGKFRATGVRPKFYEKLKSAGVTIPQSVFQTNVEIS
jgi:pilus assembly protein CpaF